MTTSIDGLVNLRETADSQFFVALGKYNARYNNATYLHATKGSSSKRVGKLIAAAMALCGSPYHKLSAGSMWTGGELAFLTLFC